MKIGDKVTVEGRAAEITHKCAVFEREVEIQIEGE